MTKNSIDKVKLRFKNESSGLLDIISKIIFLIFFKINALKKVIITTTSIFCLLSSYGQERTFSPWLVPKEGKPLLSYIEPIIASGSGDHISMFVKPENYDRKEWDEFISASHEGGIRIVYLAVGGSEKSFDTPEARKKTVDKWILKAKKYAFDGIDMDIEHITPEVKNEHIKFVKYAAERLHKEGLKLAMAVGYYPAMLQKPFVWWYDPVTIGNYCDNIRIMLYDQNFGGGKMDDELKKRLDCYGMGPTCSYPYAEQALNFWMEFVPTEKLTINIPAYSNIYYLDPQYNVGVKDLYAKNGQSYYPSPQDINKDKPVHKYWSWLDRIWVYIYTSSIDGRLKKFYAADKDSTSHLLSLFQEKGISSVGMWIYDGNSAKKQWQEMNKIVLDWASSEK
ncbi:glycosyl hydrolase family 18 protein [Flavivirga jejuensis]|uniref:Glycosyl hydrolase family 18 protein n=1 Tax=Flavivirga jejuensis TaxID=870487 RepID=A0ABT8WV69_9FLAO|nr:glycosyl hydrolase family 18 protein [Flavivirga jejuensis]MDO5976979.1 glycosyl hydrolase family 18 protein [Flavivirga jejuensis]